MAKTIEEFLTEKPVFRHVQVAAQVRMRVDGITQKQAYLSFKGAPDHAQQYCKLHGDILAQVFDGTKYEAKESPKSDKPSKRKPRATKPAKGNLAKVEQVLGKIDFRTKEGKTIKQVLDLLA